MIRTVCAAGAVLACLAVTPAFAQSMGGQTFIGQSTSAATPSISTLMRQSCWTSATQHFGSMNVALAGQTPRPNGMTYIFNSPNRDSWRCHAVRNSS